MIGNVFIVFVCSIVTVLLVGSCLGAFFRRFNQRLDRFHASISRMYNGILAQRVVRFPVFPEPAADDAPKGDPLVFVVGTGRLGSNSWLHLATSVDGKHAVTVAKEGLNSEAIFDLLTVLKSQFLHRDIIVYVDAIFGVMRTRELAKVAGVELLPHTQETAGQSGQFINNYFDKHKPSILARRVNDNGALRIGSKKYFAPMTFAGLVISVECRAGIPTGNYHGETFPLVALDDLRNADWHENPKLEEMVANSVEVLDASLAKRYSKIKEQ